MDDSFRLKLQAILRESTAPGHVLRSSLMCLQELGQGLVVFRTALDGEVSVSADYECVFDERWRFSPAAIADDAEVEEASRAVIASGLTLYCISEMSFPNTEAFVMHVRSIVEPVGEISHYATAQVVDDISLS